VYYVLSASHDLKGGTQLLKFKLMKSYSRSSIAQDRLDSLALISIENDAARQLDLDELVNTFAKITARKNRVLSSGRQFTN